MPILTIINSHHDCRRHLMIILTKRSVCTYSWWVGTKLKPKLAISSMMVLYQLPQLDTNNASWTITGAENAEHCTCFVTYSGKIPLMLLQLLHSIWTKSNGYTKHFEKLILSCGWVQFQVCKTNPTKRQNTWYTPYTEVVLCALALPAWL